MGKAGPKPYTWPQVLVSIDARTQVGQSDQCWPWLGGKTTAGYATINARAFADQPLLVHRIVLERKLGRRLVKGEEAMHTCDNPPCLNPGHLRVGSHADNMRDAKAKGRLKIGGRTSATWTKDKPYNRHAVQA